MSARHTIAVVAAALALVGCSGSSGGTTSSGSPTPAAGSTSPSASPTAVSLAGRQAVDISWSPQPELDVPCPKGLHGYCSHIQGSGSDDKLGVLTLDETLATPGDSSCSTGAVEGTFSLVDDPKSAIDYTGTGTFCWKSLTGKFALKVVRGTGTFRKTTGKLTAKITNGTVLADEWKGTLDIKG